MLEICCIHERQHMCLLFLVGILLCFTTNPSFSSKLRTTKCFEKDAKFLYDMRSECTIHYNHSYLDDCCSWPGISCSNLTGRVIHLDLFLFLQDCFSGEWKRIPLSPSRVSLEDLVSLDVSFEKVSFPDGFPSFVSSFPNLRHLYLSFDAEPGMVIPPKFGNLTRLETLEVYPYSTTYGKTFSMLSHLTSLKRLVLSYVTFSQATDWLRVVSNLPRLEHLDLSHCNLPHAPNSYSSELGINSSVSLTYLDLSFNNLQASSTWPWIFNQRSVISLLLSNNKLNGSIPNRFRGMASLSHLDLSYNKLEGWLPSSFGGLCGLSSLDVSQNHRLRGDLSSIFQSLTCAKESLMVLSLQRNLFSGSLPDFSTFTRLTKLSLHSNRLNGSFPSYVKRHSSLIIFDVHNNHLTGSVPDLSVFTSLRVLQFQNNKLNGSIHPGLGQISSLKHLDVSSNSLKGVLGVNHLANLSSLRYLDLSFNSLTLKVGSSWVPPFVLDTIGLASCGLGSRLPNWLQTQTNYSRLDVSNSGISGTVPFWFWNLSSVATFLSLSHNRLHGKLPLNLSIEFSRNPGIDLSVNSFEGSIPSSFVNTAYLNLSRNSFSGSVVFLCQNSTNKFGIDLSHNNLSGTLPDCWSKIATLSVLDLSNNSFSGQLPSSLGKITYLQSLHLGINKFSGNLPLFLCDLTYLLYLDLGDNFFSGEIPSCSGQMLNNLTVLSLRNNAVSGSIPPQLCNPSIQILDLSMNNISGVIPECLCNLQAMTQKKSRPVVMRDSNGTFATIGAPYKDYISLVLKGYLYNDGNHLELVKSLDLSSNNLGGKIPDGVSCLTGLISLNFSGNNLTGPITSKIGSLTFLESLDLSDNRLSGEIPSTISELNFLGTLNLANNNLSGKIPTGTQIQGFSASDFSGNPYLCGDPLPKCPGDSKKDGENLNAQSPKDGNDAFNLGLYISVALGFITGFWGICGALVLKKSWRISYFRFWNHACDRLYVFVSLKVLRLQRRFLD